MSCDTMVALGSATTDGKVLFAKNSDRPEDEIQTFVYVPKKKHGADAKLRCTHIVIPQVAETYECALSQPLWMWGAEMGFNEHNVVIGNEAVWTKEGDGPAALLGMDLVRLGLERSKTAKQALDVITKLLETHGQGGPCGQHDKAWSYNNSFLVADPTEAWVIETAGKWWVAERVRDGVRSISNALSIHTKFDLSSKGIQEHAKSRNYWDGKESFDFAKAFAAEESGPDDEESRELRVKKMLAHGCAHGRKISTRTLINILRDHEAGVCMHGAFASTASLVSHLGTTPIHYITATTAPCESFFKPIKMTEITTLPTDGWTEDHLKDEKERKRATGSSRSDELLSARLAAEEALNETENRDLVLGKLQRQIHALEAKYLTVTEGPAPTSDKKKDVEPTPPLSPTAASIPSDKLFITAVTEELELYKKIIPPATATPIAEETPEEVEHDGAGTEASTTSAASAATSSAATSSPAATPAATPAAATTSSPSTTSTS